MEKQYLKKGSLVSWFACGGKWYGTVKFTVHQWVYVKTKNQDHTQCFNIDDPNLTLEKA